MGGAIFLMFGSVSLQNSTLSNNSAIAGRSSGVVYADGLGGAVFNLRGTLSIVQSTLFGNSVSAGNGVGVHGRYDGVSVYNLSLGGQNPVASFTMQNSILYGAPTFYGVAPDVFNDRVAGTATVFVIGQSIVRSRATQGGGTISNGSAIFSADPKLGLLKNNGGLTFTHYPACDSPARQAGDPAICAQFSSDQLGQPRPSSCTLGAIEPTHNCAGDRCTTAADCTSGFCTDGVCCNVACGDSNPNDCQACSVAKGAAKDGTCALVPASQVCRSSQDQYDPAEVCDGLQASCPDDVSGVPILRGAGGGFSLGCTMSLATATPSCALFVLLCGAALFALTMRRRKEHRA